MLKKRNLIFWCLVVFLAAFGDARASDTPSSVTSGEEPTANTFQSRETPASVHLERSAPASAAAPAANRTATLPDKWQTRAALQVSSPGLVESALIPELHRIPANTDYSPETRLDIGLYGPEGKPRSFELFWREKGQPETVALDPARVELTEDRRLLWAGVVPDTFMVSKIVIDIAAIDYVGKVDVEGLNDSGWILLAENAALYKNNRVRQAEIKIDKGVYKRFRLSFKGYDKKYGETPLFVRGVQAVGARTGRDYATTSFQPEFTETTDDPVTEVRLTLPGSGIWIDDIKIKTDALFQGTWQLGREDIVLGKRKFVPVASGQVTHVSENKQTLGIDVDRRWLEQVLVIKMTSEDFFGGIQGITLHARIPRMAFFADLPGRYVAYSGCGNPTKILDLAGDRDRKIDHQADFSDITLTTRTIHENLIEKYNVSGGPFNKNGYNWRAEVRVEEPGFYQLQLNKRVCLQEKPSTLRLVKENNQIPYFAGFEEERQVRLQTSKEYNADLNRSVYTIRLPVASPHWSAVKLSAAGIFERELVFQKHTPGMVGWQSWQTRRWVSQQDQKTDFVLDLSDFPQGQDEIQLIINHEDNQPIEIEEISAVYRARDLFFLAATPGTYLLFGGNPDASPVSYEDFEMIKDELLAAVPRQAPMGKMQAIPSVNKKDLAGKKVEGGPFDASGYTWTSPLTGITKPGFYQLRLNQKASLENNRQGVRLVRGNQQVPFFMGSERQRRVTLSPEKKYDRKNNKTVWLLRLPQASDHWTHIRLFAEGVFSRKVAFELRNPGNTGWHAWRQQNWINRHAGEAVLEVPLRLPADQTEFRLVMWHGDNKPLEVKKMEAVYTTRDMFFIADQSGGYQLAGGNLTASAPSYDLALIKNNVLTKEPIPITMDEIETMTPAGWITKISHTFSEQGWGLYVVLGLVTLVLLIVIVRLFPKEEREGSADN